MKGIIVTEPGAAPEVSTNLKVPDPSHDQILVKSIYTAVNPVDAYMADYGLLVESWPLVPGCDAGGVVVKAGKDAISPLGKQFKIGDKFLMDAAVTIPKPENLNLVESSTTGVSILTAFLGIFDGLQLAIPNAEDLPVKGTDENWVLVFGGASSVGKSAVQTLKALGYKIATTCSERNFESLKSVGADLTVSYKSSDEDLISSLERIVGSPSKLNLIFDAVAVNNALASKIFEAFATSSDGPKRFTTTNDWDPKPTNTLFTTRPIELGPIGRPDAPELNKQLNELIPLAVEMLEKGLIKPGSFDIEEETGVEGLLGGWKKQREGKNGSRKVVVKIADE